MSIIIDTHEDVNEDEELVIFPPEFYEINVDEAKLVILKIIEQSIRDYMRLEKATHPIDKENYESAVSFLFSDEHYIQYGDLVVNLEDLLNLFNIEIEWFRRLVSKLKRERKMKRFSIGKLL